jgi:hypothetical protein
MMMMLKKRRNDLVVLGLALLISAQCFAQGVDPAKFAEIQKGNSQALKVYTWTQRFELQLKGETKKVTLNMVRSWRIHGQSTIIQSWRVPIRLQRVLERKG